MKVLDVDLLHDGLIRNINRMNRLEKEITAIQKAVSELTAMEEALKGEGGQAIRDFYTSCHLPFLQYFLSFKEEFNTVLQQAQQALVSLEPVDAGHIVEEFLETKVEEGLTESATITAALTDEANAIMDEVSDIVGLPKLDDTLVQESVADAKTKRDDTVEALHTFDSTQTTQLVPIESSIQSMKEWVQNIEGLFQEGLTDVNFPTDKWSSITGNSAIAMSLSAMGVENGIDSQEMLACERPVETDVKEDKAWYKVVGDVLVGIAEGVAKAIADIFTGLFDLLKNLFTDPVGFFGGLATAIMNPIDTAKQMWGAVEAAWERDVVNGDARSRAEFFSYAVVSVVGLKGVDKLGKAGKVGNAASKADNALPYNAMKTDKLKETLKTNVYATVQQKTQQAADFWKSNFSKEAINKTIEAVKNSAIITKAKNVIDPANIKTAAAKTYEDVVKTPIAKTQAALKAKKEQLLDMPLPNFGLAPVPLGPTTNMTVREGIEAAKDTVMQVVGKQDGGGERNKEEVFADPKWSNDSKYDKVRGYRGRDLTKYDEKYLVDPRLVVEMNFKGKASSGTNAAGWERNAKKFFNTLLKSNPEFWSAENTALIKRGRVPNVDEQFIKHFPQYKEYLEDPMRHHHIGEGGQAVALPKSLHPGYGGIHNVEKDWGITGIDDEIAVRLETFLNNSRR